MAGASDFLRTGTFRRILTCVGHPDLAQICDGCRKVVESWAAEAGQQVNAGDAAPISDAELRDYTTHVGAWTADSYAFSQCPKPMRRSSLAPRGRHSSRALTGEFP
jgi:hypothetical protein